MTKAVPDPPFELSGLERLLLGLLLVPPAPAAPEGDPRSIQIFNAGRNYYIWCLIMWAGSVLVGLMAVVPMTLALIQLLSRASRLGQTALIALMVLVWTVLASVALVTLLSRRLNYGLRWYIVTDRSLRIRSGILSIDELTMTYGNIQEIRVTSGPLQLLLGLADVEVHAAGGGARSDGKPGGGHVGRFSGVANANEIRDLILDRLRHYRDAGLGDTPHTTAAHATSSELDAARQLLDEAKALREVFAR